MVKNRIISKPNLKAEHLRNIIKEISDGILIVNKEGIILFANPVAERLLQFKNKSLKGEMFGFPIAEKNIAELDINTKGYNTVVEMKVKTIEWQGEPCYLASLRDITDRKKAEKERIRLATAIEHTAEGIVIIDKEGNIQYINPAFEKTSGYKKSELFGKNIKGFKGIGINAALIDNLLSKTMQGKQWRGHLSKRKKNGEVYEVEASISPILDKEGDKAGYVICERDVTYKMIMERQLRQSQKLEAIGTLAGGIAHDFNNILMAIIGYTDITIKQLKHDKVSISNLNQILKASYRARDLVKQILTFSRQNEQENQPLNLKTIVKESLRFLRASLPATISIYHRIGRNIKYIYADPTQCYQVLMNLCTNAAHAMQEKGGILEISLSNEKLDKESASLFPDIKPGNYVKLVVRDTGCGINPDIKEKIFEPYFTTKEKNKGTGLGLALVHGIVKKLKGAITVESQVGKGTVFSLYLPAVQVKDVKKKRSMGVATGNERILFVDDEKTLAQLGQRMLTALGYKVLAKTNSKEALDFFTQNPNQFDLVITDMTMPYMRGDKLATRILKIRPDIPIILCTGYNESMNEEKAKSLGIALYLTKPLNMNEFGDAVRKALNRSGEENHEKKDRE